MEVNAEGSNASVQRANLERNLESIIDFSSGKVVKRNRSALAHRNDGMRWGMGPAAQAKNEGMRE